MTDNFDKNTNLYSKQLRRRAERQFTITGDTQIPHRVPIADDLIHELHVHQIELEMQNEELRRTQVALESSRAHYLELYDFAPIGYLTLTDEGIITEMNLTAAKLLGGDRNHLIQRRFAQFVVDGHKDLWHHFLTLARQRVGKQSVELPICREDGAKLFVKVDCESQEADGKRQLLPIVLTDITIRTLAEVALRESEAKLSLKVDEVNSGYWDWDLDAKLLYLSPGWKRQLGLENNEVPISLDQTEDRLHPDDRDRVVAATENFIAGRQPDYDLQFRLRHKDGTYRWIHSRGALVRDPKGRPIRMLGLNLDITDYKQASELERQRTEMERDFRSQVATQTAAAIAHELSQPLTAVAYYAYVAQELLETNNWIPYTLSGILEKCSQQAQRAGDVIRLLMEILQKDDVASEPVDITASVHYALAFVKAQTDLDAVNIRLELEEDLPQVSVNPMQIQKIVTSLLQNGLESMREGGKNTGTITVNACRFPENPDMVQVTVSDCGKGVADAAGLETLFQPLFPTKAKSVGLSLAVSQALIHAHGGKMWAQQNVGPGLSISFTLPIVP